MTDDPSFRISHIDRGPSNSDSLVVALSQSGETVDVLDAMAVARAARSEAGGDRQYADVDAGPNGGDARAIARGRRAVCLATKSYTAMLATLLLAAHAVDGRWSTGADQVLRAADAIESMLVNGSRDRIKASRDAAWPRRSISS